MGPQHTSSTTDTAAQRPATRSDARRPAQRPISEVLADLAGTRGRYEDLRISAGPLEERARLMTKLHDLRAEAFIARHETGRR